MDILHRATDELIAKRASHARQKSERTRSRNSVLPADAKRSQLRETAERGRWLFRSIAGWGPYCNLECRHCRSVPEIHRRGASMVAISPQTAPNSRKYTSATTSWLPDT